MLPRPLFATTRGIRVEVSPSFAPKQSAPALQQWVFIYLVRIVNQGREPVALRFRHWEITDAEGKVQIVDGDGVVGEQPLIGAGDAFEYSSGCMLRTPYGTMRGHYSMELPDGARFPARIPLFRLVSDYGLH